MYRLALLCLFTAACTQPGMHYEGAPVSWSVTTADSPEASSKTVCESPDPKPCVLPQSTAEHTVYSSFVLHLWGPRPTKFAGSVIVGYFGDPDPRRYRSPVELTSDGREIHHRTFSRVTTVPGHYTVRIQLTESPESGPTREHDLTVPVTVQ